MNLEIDYFQGVKDEIVSCVAARLSEPTVKSNVIKLLNDHFDMLKPHLNIKAIDYCLNAYINAELDYQTAGDRGIGRLSSFVPRLGAYFRKQLSALSTEKLNQLYLLIQNLILKSYLFMALYEDSFEITPMVDGPKLLEEWIPTIYTSASDILEERMENSLRWCTDSAHDEIMTFFKKNGMKKWLPYVRKIGLILNYYPIAGITLRFTEIYRIPKTS